MFVRKDCVLRLNLINNILLRNSSVSWFQTGIPRDGLFIRNEHVKPLFNKHFGEKKYQTINIVSSLCRKWYSKGLPEGEVTDSNDYNRIKELFPSPRATLNNLTEKTSHKVFDLHFKQYVAPKIGKKKVQNLDWTCSYTFVWPEKMKFECTALSKRQAAEKAATQALHWLYTNKRIDKNGHPIYDKKVIDDMQNTLNATFEATVSDISKEKIDQIWNEYENGIKQIFQRTSDEVKSLNHIVATSDVFNKDSSIDEEEISEIEGNIGENISCLSESNELIHPIYGKVLSAPSEKSLNKKSKYLETKFQEYDENITALPIDHYVSEITSTLESNRVCVITGAAGCGKSTRVPPAILKHGKVNANLVVTQPRRVAAIGLAERVASEMQEEVGETIGYVVRLQSKPPRPPVGSILYCTSGVLLNRLQRNPGLTGCSHVVIDEAHERDVNTDVTMLLLKRAMQLNQQLKLIIMSATLDTEVFTKYFDSCPVIEVPGRTYPVEISYLDDIERKFNLKLTNSRENCKREDGRPHINVPEIVETIKVIDKNEKEGAILVFLPGWAEIKHAKTLLDEYFSNTGTHMILPVHSRLSTSDQTKMFSIPPPGIRKIVLATNVAETSITIPDVVYTVDAGALKQNMLNQHNGMATLDTVWVSLASAKQRAGRAGRVQPGFCFRMYTKEKEDEFELHNTPEILRIPLERTILDCKSYASDVKAHDFLSQLPEPPTENAIKFAVKELIDIGALTQSEEMTRLGTLLATLALPPRSGLCLLNSAVFGTSVAISNILVHIDSNIEVFINAADRKAEIREIKRKLSPNSDHIAFHLLQQDFERQLETTNNNWKEIDKWCDKHTVRKERLAYVKSLSNLYLTQLLKSGIIEPNLESDEINRFSDIDELTTATLLSGIERLLVSKRYVKTKGKLKTVYGVFTSTGSLAHISTSSVVYPVSSTRLLVPGVSTHCRLRRAAIVYSCSTVQTEAVLVTANHVERYDIDENTTILKLPKYKLEIQVPTSHAETFLKTKEMLRNTFQYYINRDIKKLQYEEYEKVSSFKMKLIKAIGRILVEANKERKYLEH